MTNALVLALLPLAFGFSWQGIGAGAPRFEARNGEPRLILTSAMELALRRFDPEFTIRRLIDHPPYMWRPGCTWSPDCARALYRLDPRQSPFAVIGDFNGDGRLDVVVDGDNRTRGRRIVLLSNRQSFSAAEIDSPVRISDELESSRAGNGGTRDWESGLDVGLSAARPGTYRSHWETQALVLKTDGFVVDFFEKASVLYYQRDGKWNKFTLSD